MLLFRSAVLGLVGACFLLLATRRPVRPHVDREREIIYRPAPPVATIVDVAAGLTPEQLGSLVRLEPSEHVIAVGERAVTGDLDAGAVLAKVEPHAPQFVDLTFAGGRGGQRRIVLLLH